MWGWIFYIEWVEQWGATQGGAATYLAVEYLEEHMEIANTGKEKDRFILAVTGRMDAVTAPEFENRVLDWINAGETHLVVDFEGLEYISSAGLRSILTIAKNLKTRKGQMALCSLRDTVKEVFEISGFSTIIPVFESIDAAIKDT
jgi:anti-anti-sigma factor